jgi:hypothetical protein
MNASPYRPASSYGDRIVGVLRLDPRAFRDVEQDTGANGQAAMTVFIAAIASGIGALFSRNALQNVIGIGISSILQWIVFSFVAYFVGASLFSSGQTSVTPGQVLRTIGFAQAPKFFAILGIIPILGWIVGLIVFVWFIAAAILALKEAFEFDTGRAIGTGIVALIGIVLVDIVLGIVFGIGSALFGGLDSMVRGVI